MRKKKLTTPVMIKVMESKEDMVVDMEEEASNKDELIVKLRTKSGTLETENKVLKEQLEQMKHVVMNMNNALEFYCNARLHSRGSSIGMSDGFLLTANLVVNSVCNI